MTVIITMWQDYYYLLFMNKCFIATEVFCEAAVKALTQETREEGKKQINYLITLHCSLVDI